MEIGFGTSVNAHVYAVAALDAYRSRHDGRPVISIGPAGRRLTIFFGNDAAARRFAEAILALLGVQPAANPCVCSGPPHTADCLAQHATLGVGVL